MIVGGYFKERDYFKKMLQYVYVTMGIIQLRKTLLKEDNPIADVKENETPYTKVTS